MDAVPSPSLWSTVAALPDYLLLAQTAQLARHEQALQILVLDHLREIEARRLHLTRGYGSLFDYVVHELGYTAAAAWRRIKAMRLCAGIGAARELLQDGSLNLSNAAQLQNLFERSDRSRGRPPGGDGRVGGLGGAPRNDGEPGAQAPGEPAPMSAGGRDPAPPAAGPAPAAGPVLDAAAREELVRQAAGKSTREVQQMLAEVDPELAQPSDRVRALGGGRWELKAAVDTECRHGLEKLQMLLSHRDPHLTLGGLVARLVRDGLDRYDPERPPRARRTGGRGSADGAHSASTPARRDTEPVQRNVGRAKGNDTGAVERNVARAEGGGVERRSEVERDDASFGAAVRIGTARPSAAKRAAEAEHGSTKSAPVGSSGGHPTSPAKRHRQTEPGRTSRAARRADGGRAASAAKRDTEADRRQHEFRGGEASRARRGRAYRERGAPWRRSRFGGGTPSRGRARMRATDRDAWQRRTYCFAGEATRASRGRSAGARRNRNSMPANATRCRRRCAPMKKATTAPARGMPVNATRCRHWCGTATGLLRRRSGWRTPPGMARWGRRSVRRRWSGTSPRCAAAARCRAPGHGTSRPPCGGRCGGETRVVAAMSTVIAGGAAAPAIGWRSTTSCHSRSAAVRSPRISGSVAMLTTGCGAQRHVYAEVCRLKPGALGSSRSIPRNAGGWSDRMRQSRGPGSDRATVATCAPAAGGRCEAAHRRVAEPAICGGEALSRAHDHANVGARRSRVGKES